MTLNPAWTHKLYPTIDIIQLGMFNAINIQLKDIKVQIVVNIAARKRVSIPEAARCVPWWPLSFYFCLMVKNLITGRPLLVTIPGLVVRAVLAATPPIHSVELAVKLSPTKDWGIISKKATQRALLGPDGPLIIWQQVIKGGNSVIIGFIIMR